MYEVGWSADGSFLAATGAATPNSPVSIWLYRVTGRHIFQRLAGHRNGVQCVTASPHLERIASGADDHIVINWDLATTRPSRRWSATKEQAFVSAVAYSPDGSLLATGTGGTRETGAGRIVVRGAETGEIEARLAGQQVGIYSLAFDPSAGGWPAATEKGRPSSGT
jgi:WD40 repeat protein